MNVFEPTLAAAQARLAAVRPDAYARTRNAIDGAVTRLSPYLTHGLLSLREVHDTVAARHPLHREHKFVYELGWRAYFHHVWDHRGDGILGSLRPGPLPESAYAREVPQDVREGRTGIPAIDQAVRALYAEGYLHNHARMWLASYLVHLRKVHWRAGADWMLGHLLDGDLASNHLSWQWVAGTGSSKPYLFNAENVARFAPRTWHSPRTVIDTDYEALDRIARTPAPVGAWRGAGGGVEEPACLPSPADTSTWETPAPGALAGRDVWLVHPWSLGPLPADLPAGTAVVGVALREHHAAFPWSAKRWDFAARGMAALAPVSWWTDAGSLADALRGARSAGWQEDPHLGDAGQRLRAVLPPGGWRPRTPPPLFTEVDGECASFSRWWSRTRPA